MTTLAEERPYAAVISDQFAEQYCAACLEKCSALIACEQCATVAYCTPKCQRRDWREVHEYECEVLQKLPEGRILTSMTRLALRIMILRCGTRLKTEPAFNGTRFEDLEKNEKFFGASTTYQKFMTDFNTVFFSIAGSVLRRIDEKWSTTLRDPAQSFPILKEIVCVCMANSFSVSDELSHETFATALYLGMSKHDHACSSTSHIIFDGGLAKLRSLEETEYSTNITISYVSRLLPTYERQEDLKKVHFFLCKCELCLDDGKESEAMSTRCPNCKGTVPLESTCSCGKSQPRTFTEVKKIMDAAKEELKKLVEAESQPTLEQYYRLYKKYRESLGTSNSVLLQLAEATSFALIGSTTTTICKEDLHTLLVDSCRATISKISLGRPETTRRLYATCANRNLVDDKELLQMGLESSRLSHGPGAILSQFEQFSANST